MLTDQQILEAMEAVEQAIGAMIVSPRSRYKLDVMKELEVLGFVELQPTPGHPDLFLARRPGE